MTGLALYLAGCATGTALTLAVVWPHLRVAREQWRLAEADKWAKTAAADGLYDHVTHYRRRVRSLAAQKRRTATPRTLP